MKETADQIKEQIELVDKKVKSKVLDLLKPANSFKLPQEDFQKSQDCFERLKVAELSNSILALSGFACAAIASDIEYTRSLDTFIARDVLLITCSLSTVLLLMSVVWRTKCGLKWERARALYSKFDTIWTARKLRQLLVEVLLNIVHPLWFLQDLEFESHNSVYNVDLKYAYNDMLMIFMICRVYHFVNLYSIFSKYRTDRAYRVCSINGRFAGTSWAVKCVMNDNPFRVVSVMLIFGMLIGGFCLRIFERPLYIYTNLDFSYYGNAIWCVILTMTTVGYGDYYPSSLPGRIIGLVICIWGVLMVSIMVCSVTNMLSLSTFEEKTLSLYRKLAFREAIKVAAANMLVNAYRFKQTRRKDPENDKLISIRLARFQRSLKEFQRFRLKKKILYNLNSTEDNIDRRINYINTLVRRYSDNQLRLQLSLAELLN
jgi:potassium intermediate/small conductance calcium-activated channel subfamily N protein 2